MVNRILFPSSFFNKKVDEDLQKAYEGCVVNWPI